MLEIQKALPELCEKANVDPKTFTVPSSCRVMYKQATNLEEDPEDVDWNLNALRDIFKEWVNIYSVTPKEDDFDVSSFLKDVENRCSLPDSANMCYAIDWLVYISSCMASDFIVPEHGLPTILAYILWILKKMGCTENDLLKTSGE